MQSILFSKLYRGKNKLSLSREAVNMNLISLWIDPTMAKIHNPPHSRQAHLLLHHQGSSMTEIF